MAGEMRFSVDPTEFAGKRVLITGGTKGMGEAMVRRFQSSGAAVATTARSPLPEGQDTRKSGPTSHNAWLQREERRSAIV